MKKNSLLFIALAVSLGLVGCAENQTRIGEGAGIGGVLGGGVGSIIGYQSGHPLEGALIGGAVGAGSGALVGSQIEKPHPTTTSQASSGNNLSMREIIDLTKHGYTSDEIIAKIRSSNSRYNLTADDISYLSKQGVSQRVVDAMQGQ